MKIDLKYGRHGLQVELPDKKISEVFRTKNMPAIERPLEKLRYCLENPIASPPLSEIAVGKRDACIVVSDITRPVPNAVLLPPLIDMLERAGMAAERIRLLVATGIHREPTDTELLEMLGDKIVARHQVLVHDARDPSRLIRIGYSSRQTPIDINRTYIESDMKIVTGLVEPHFMAGYSGGRKSVAIGLTSVESVRHLHGPKFLEHQGSSNCELQNNPLHREITEIALLAGIDFCVNAVINAERRVAGVFCGDAVESHNSACEFARQYCVVHVDKPFDIVVTTGAGYPLDTTYYQAIKGLVGSLGILSPQGGIILASECSNGLGSDDFRHVLQNLRNVKDYDRFLAHISVPDNFAIDQWEVEMLIKALRRGKIFLFSEGIPEHDWSLTFATKIKSVEDGISHAIATRGGHPRIAVIPEGPYVIPFADNIAMEDSRRSSSESGTYCTD